MMNELDNQSWQLQVFFIVEYNESLGFYSKNTKQYKIVKYNKIL